MLLFHGGLPRSGKSYEAVVEHLIPALKKGRKVYARINGLNYEKIAELAEITLEQCRERLVHLSEDDVRGLETLAFDTGSLLILDEAQNFWPESRKNLNPQLTQFVAEHGHKGLDILLMGQEFKDVHKLWKNRVSQRVQFRKLDMLGKGNEYAWILFKATDPQKFEQVTKGRKKYDPKYFGSYASFVPGAEENQLYEDKRANIWQSPMFRKWIPLFGVALVVALGYLVYLFSGGGMAKELGGEVKPKPKPVAVAPQPVQPVRHTNDQVKKAEPEKDKKKDFEREVDGSKKWAKDFVTELCEKYRIRLTGVMVSAHKQTAIIEWFDEGMRVVERLDMVTLGRLGYAVTIDPDMLTATLRKGDFKYYATSFPLETNSRMADNTVRAISSHSGAPARGNVVVLDKEGYGLNGRVDGVRVPAS